MSNEQKMLDAEARKLLCSEWFEADKNAKYWKAKELELRKLIFEGTFLDPVEGSKNECELGDGYVVKGDHKLNRSIDEGALGAIREALRDKQINVDLLVKYTPKLSVSEYRKLSEENRLFFDQCLVIKEGTPGLSIVKGRKS